MVSVYNAYMAITVGCDIVNIQRFKQSVRRGGVKFLARIFSDHELAGSPSVETLAGMFAAKEAALKALGLKLGEWHNIEVYREADGRPKLRLLLLSSGPTDIAVSISHDGEYALAVICGTIKDDPN